MLPLEISQVEPLKNLYLSKKKYMEQILILTQQQEELVANQSMEMLGDLLQNRAKLMAQVDRVDKEIALSKDEIKTEDIQCLGNDIKSILSEIINLDNKNRNNLDKEYSVIKQKMQQLKMGKDVQRSYYPNRQQSYGYFIDNKK